MIKPKQGDSLFIKTKRSQVHCTVKSVGRKYFTVESDEFYGEIKFTIETWGQKTESNDPDYYLYESEQAWKDEKKRQRYMCVLQGAFGYIHDKKYTLKQLEEAANILKIEID
jgi:hypothetical protein